MLFASELLVSTQSVSYVIYPGSYNYTNYSLGDLIVPTNSGSNPTDSWIGPLPMGVARPMEATVAIPSIFPWATQFQSASVGNAGMDWVFLADGAATSITRRIVMYEYNKETSNFNWKGFVTLNFPCGPNAPAATYTPRSFAMNRTLYSSGTATVNGQYVTGSQETLWYTSGMSGGARIGFGSQDPTKVSASNWFDINYIYNDTTMQITQSVGAPIISSSYVIDELRALHTFLGSSAPSGGLFLTKGLSYNTFQPGGVTIQSASFISGSPNSGSFDNVRSTYWLMESNNVNNSIITSSVGLGYETMSADYKTQNVYVVTGPTTATNAQIFKFNIRAPLTGSMTAQGRSTGSFILSTSLQSTGAGNNIPTNPANAVRMGTLYNSPNESILGTPCVFFTTIKTIVACPLSLITSGSVNFMQYTMTEVPPLGVGAGAFAATSLLNSIEIDEKIDKLYVPTLGTTSFKVYATAYRTDGTAMDNYIFSDNKQQDQGGVGTSLQPYPSVDVLPFTIWSENGMAYVCRGSMTTAPTAVINQMYAIPLGAHYEYTNISNESLITPVIYTPSATKYYRVYVNMQKQVGSDALAISPEAYKVYVRTGGITDNSGGWTLVNDAGTLTGQSATSGMIQFKIEFKVLGNFGITGRFYGLAVTYEAGGYLPSQLQWTLSDSNTTDGTIGFSQTSLFGLVPNLQIDYYRSDTNADVLTQASTSTTNGSFQYWSGATWTAGVGTDTVGLRRRFVPTAGLPTGVNVYAKITTF